MRRGARPGGGYSSMTGDSKKAEVGEALFYMFSERARRVVAHAHNEAYARHSEYIGTAHLLLGLIHDSDVARMLQVLGADPRAVRRHVEHTIGRAQRVASRELPVTPQARKALDRSLHEARRRGHHLVDAEHVLYGLISEANSSATKAVTVVGARPARIIDHLFLLWGPPNPSSPVAPPKPQPPRARQ
jgi:ATP-dependent Clp protease ATP-binding subunit ClpC